MGTETRAMIDWLDLIIIGFHSIVMFIQFCFFFFEYDKVTSHSPNVRVNQNVESK